MVRAYCLVIWENDVVQNRKTFWSVIPSGSVVGIDNCQTESEVKKECSVAYWGKDKKQLKCKIERFEGKYIL